VLRRLLVLALVALPSVLLPLQPATAAPYTPKIPTTTLIKIVVAADHSVSAVVKVVANSGKGHPHGTVTLQIEGFAPTARGARAAAPAPWESTVDYNGGWVTVQAPALSLGTYVANASFTPSGKLYRSSSTSTRFAIGASPAEQPNPGSRDEGPLAGLLPDTGGPALLWLFVGVGLVGSGAVAVGYNRRRRALSTAA
jgi:hypothetical protein